MNASKSLFLVQEDHLFSPSYLKGHNNDLFLMVEDKKQLSSFNFHKHRLVLFLSAMRHYARELKHNDFNLVYFELDETSRVTSEDILEKVLKESALTRVVTFEIEDKLREKQLHDFCEKNGVTLEIKNSPLFLTPRQGFKNYLEQYARPSVKTFYEAQRRKLNILMEPTGEPVGGRFSFSDEERLKWSKEDGTPKFPASIHNEIDQQVIHLVEKEFPSHPGDAHTFWYPTTRNSAHEALYDFCKYRLAEYGPYEDTLCRDQDFLFHSVLAPVINIGLLTPHEVLTSTLSYASENPVSLNSLESFVKKILGYREYVRGIYQNFNEFQEQSNFWKHHRLPNENWYQGKTQVPPLDDAIHKALRLSYNHHIERLKIICNMMNLSELKPFEAYRWFMEMHMDSAAWALGPNVYGMGLHSDGGIFANNLHICGSNYWLKISNYKKEDWCQEVDGLYWRFINKHQDFFSKNPRLSVMTTNLDRMSTERKELLWKAADAFLLRNTVYP